MKRLFILLISLTIAVVACGQEVLKRDLEIRKTAPLLNLNGSGATLQFYNGDVSLTQSSNLLTISGGNFSLGANSLLGSGSIGATGARLLKGWFTDLEITNLPTVNGATLASALSLTGYLLKSDTATMLTPYVARGDTALMLTPYIARGDTSLMLTPYISRGDTALMLQNYVLTSELSVTETRVDSIVAVLADTANIETLLQVDLDTDTLATRAYARSLTGVSIGDVQNEIADSLNVLRPLYVAVADTAAMLDPYSQITEVSTQINDTITARIAAATVGVAAADSNVYAGYTTRTYVESLLGSGSGLSAQRLPFIVGVTTGAPSAADTIVVHSEFEGKHIDLYRDGAKQYQQFTATNLYEGFRLSNDTIYVNPAWQANEQVMVDIIEPILWSYLSLEGQESTLLDSLNGYWKFDESSGTTVLDAVGMQDGTTNATANVVGKLGRAREFDAATDVVNIAYNANTVPSGADFSVALWFKMDSLPSVTGRENYLFQQNVGASPWSAHYIYVDDSDDKIHVGSRNTGGTAYNVLSTDALSVDTWYHVVFVNRGDGQTLQLYVNGADVSASAGTFSGTLIEALSTTCFGNSYSGAGAYLDGIIDSPGIWNKALTSDEVTELYNSGNGVTYPFN